MEVIEKLVIVAVTTIPMFECVVDQNDLPEQICFPTIAEGHTKGVEVSL